ISASASSWIQSPINTSCVLLSPQIWPTSSSLPTWVQIFVLAAFGKRQCQPLSVVAAGNPHQPNTFSVVDRLSGRSYLVDTGAEVSVYPASVQERKSQPPSSTLPAANGTSIHTWGKRKVFLAIGQKGQYQHEFYLADVTRPILGADFFIKHGLAIDLQGNRLLSLDNMSILLRETKSPLTLSGLGFPLKHEYDSLLQQFPELLTPHFHQCNNKHGVEHHIITQAPPTHSRARRLDQAKLSAAKAEFLQMEDMGIIRRSKSAWSSPLHMVPKADGNWRPCGDYRRLNASTDDDRYPLPHIQDFNNHLAGCKVFSKLDLIRGYHQIPMAPSSIPKTAVIMPARVPAQMPEVPEEYDPSLRPWRQFLKQHSYTPLARSVEEANAATSKLARDPSVVVTSSHDVPAAVDLVEIHRGNPVVIMGETTLEFDIYQSQTFRWALENASGWVVALTASEVAETSQTSNTGINKGLLMQ
ncbi:Pol polyprotein, partial [Plakobranchus ocellatus]